MIFWNLKDEVPLKFSKKYPAAKHYTDIYWLVLLCQSRMSDVVDVIYLNIVTWSVGCGREREAAKGGQLIENQGQEWMSIRTTSKKAGSPSK
jgi:hypothetical protein